MSKNAEIERLEHISSDSWYAKDLNLFTIQYSAEIFLRHIKKGSILELGPAEGVMTGILAEQFNDITSVEGSKLFCRQLKERYPSVNVIHSLFEDFMPCQTYDNILLGHVLEHVIDPVAILKLCRTWLSDAGLLFAAVPNCNSIHRQAAVIMGLLGDVDQLNETDIHHGHRRVYSPEAFKADFIAAGLTVKELGGYWIKPLSNAQMLSWDDKMLTAFMQLGEKYPDIAAEIYIIAENKRVGH